MKILGLQITRTKAAVTPMGVRTWLGGIFEGFAGAWQSGILMDSREQMLAYGAVYSCVSMISKDIGKMRPRLMRFDADGMVWQEDLANTSHAVVLRKPNKYQTRNLFWEQWIISKLIFGNTYALKERDDRGVVRRLHILDPRRVLPLVTPDGDVYYQVGGDNLAGIKQGLPAVPSEEIIHDRHTCLFHPLVGVGPLYACGAAATQGNRIQRFSAKFFANMSRPSGQLTAPGSISDPVAKRLKEEFEKSFSGENIGRVLVAGDGLKFEGFQIPADQAQMIESQRWTVEDVARTFGMPLYKIGAGQLPALSNVGALNLEYYQQTLQPLIEGAETLMDEGLELKNDQGIEFDIDGLVRMDQKTRAETNEIRVRSATLAPNEARRQDNLPPKPGGDALYMQQQNFSLDALAKRDASADPFGKAQPAAAPAANDPGGKTLEIAALRLKSMLLEAA